jgi:hypothetical protein
LPVTWRGEPVGVGTSAAALRAGVGWHAVRSSTVSFRMGAGAGVERVTFSPVSGGAAVDLAPSSSFVSPEARLLAAAELRVGRRLALSLRASCDIALLDVHHDVGGDSPRRVLSPFPLRAGLGLGAAWQL